ncbi:hypothetical protein Ahy_B04g070194 isoform F [Arachis hypogaea]|uniref:SWIM-type domain-containing protein n=1 Tax=Arachis hypogaea TaxID=3818 RepID=A0A444ZFQ5_ARAHY|nr:hypothetical protein Ahy_B04g070194 isoform F [Arachis hypogaea]
MGGKPPTAVITDGDRSMHIAIQQVFPEAHHRLCAWHLIRNATTNVCNPRFTSLFRHCMLADFEVEEFEMHWQAMVEECGTSDHEWVKDLYTKKSSWATAYIRGSFFAGIRTTSRLVRVTIVECIEADDICVYITQKYRRPDRTWNVTQNSSQDTFHCTCLRMESFGLPCVHIIAVLVRLDITSLPNSLVLPRWSKIARMDLCRDRVCNPHIDPEATYRARIRALLQHCKQRFAKVACMREEDYKTYCQKVVHETNMLEIKNGLQCQATSTHSVPWEGGVKDPIGVRTKGTGRGNEPAGSRGIKRRRCSTCGVLGHRRTRCPNGPTPSRQCAQEPDIHPSTETFETASLNPFRNDTTF